MEKYFMKKIKGVFSTFKKDNPNINNNNNHNNTNNNNNNHNKSNNNNSTNSNRNDDDNINRQSTQENNSTVGNKRIVGMTNDTYKQEKDLNYFFSENKERKEESNSNHKKKNLKNKGQKKLDSNEKDMPEFSKKMKYTKLYQKENMLSIDNYIKINKKHSLHFVKRKYTKRKLMASNIQNICNFITDKNKNENSRTKKVESLDDYKEENKNTPNKVDEEKKMNLQYEQEHNNTNVAQETKGGKKKKKKNVDRNQNNLKEDNLNNDLLNEDILTKGQYDHDNNNKKNNSSNSSNNNNNNSNNSMNEYNILDDSSNIQFHKKETPSKNQGKNKYIFKNVERKNTAVYDKNKNTSLNNYGQKPKKINRIDEIFKNLIEKRKKKEMRQKYMLKKKFLMNNYKGKTNENYEHEQREGEKEEKQKENDTYGDFEELDEEIEKDGEEKEEEEDDKNEEVEEQNEEVVEKKENVEKQKNHQNNKTSNNIYDNKSYDHHGRNTHLLKKEKKQRTKQISNKNVPMIDESTIEKCYKQMRIFAEKFSSFKNKFDQYYNTSEHWNLKKKGKKRKNSVNTSDKENMENYFFDEDSMKKETNELEELNKNIQKLLNANMSNDINVDKINEIKKYTQDNHNKSLMKNINISESIYFDCENTSAKKRKCSDNASVSTNEENLNKLLEYATNKKNNMINSEDDIKTDQEYERDKRKKNKRKKNIYDDLQKSNENNSEEVIHLLRENEEEEKEENKQTNMEKRKKGRKKNK
ncbi:hypothetical protein PFMALIP_03393 [Plasmodium falciparum MaliPS096_E11]|uniref:Uncharacterized protein n=1 Tax=Plasmodium falciparum MaliPS096_E11 TaxID=1036727 RepID=A0A024WPY3_PLAFA|nr:hypothetical protein PFMALIP_03393 [Plasmodium falciparum MaliPS096_E11]